MKEKEILNLNIGEVRKDNFEFWNSVYKEYQEGMGLRNLAEKYGSTHKTFLKIFKRYNFSLRTQDESINLSKQKREKTCLDRYGHKYPQSSEEVKNKIKNTCMEKYGVDNIFSSKDIQDEIKNTCMKKYGVEHISQAKEIKEKIKNTCMKKYGVNSYLSTQEKQEKSKITSFRKYNTNYPSQSELIKNKCKNTCLEKYGSKCFPSSEIGKKLFKDINIGKNRERISNILNEKGYELIGEYRGKYNKEDKKWISYSIKCKKCNKIFNHPIYLAEDIKCPFCYPNKSIPELNLYSYIQNLGFPDVINGFKVNGKEIDVYIPSLKLGFEFNGIYWHRSTLVGCSKHKYKTQFMLENNIRLYHIWECDDKKIVENRIQSILKKNIKKIGARKTKFGLVSKDEEIKFLNENHLHGYVNSNLAFGLYFENRLIYVISFRKCGKTNDLEIARSASLHGFNIQGGFSKILKHSINYILNNYKKCEQIITFCDRDWTPDYKESVYYKAGFEFKGDSGCILKYCNLNNGNVYSRYNFQKHKLKKIFPNSFDEKLTSNEILEKERIVPFYNSGNWKFILNIRKGTLVNKEK